ncbi:MAG: ImmA/IrrE family metallo-endopeptidase [Rhodothermaceae bacterium]|nr:ImmA/IrrE family metallo-endopeptidase [Rhodothermaceae bacterium]MXW31750.1 ImmA/IrrE family metallo-endopeptidase [Rhodothermaceae bacterium]MYC03196.1 ImmA/IrrE family metallo-endopeptidase [Rhodothermaceae bacterium]MYE62928.1 ImmA/IrrE family metallo-endopeptidase [Rhodothermaceae bacterium]MYI16898.1 ImmA/IrrE family metallo-endopeptidase [Rhodothermaceae bacterium]
MLIGKRLRQFRIARGMSLDTLARAMGDVVTKQALSKYERGASLPSQIVLKKLAETLNVSIASLNHRPVVEVETIEFRKRSRLSKREQYRIESLSQYALEERIRLLDMLGEFDGSETALRSFRVNSIEEAEKAAEQLRSRWGLGNDPIPSMVALLENKQIHVIEIDAAESFDGLSLRAKNNERVEVSAGVVTRRGIPGDRQRLSLAHELGHLVLDVAPDVDNEKAAYRFGGAFLAPADMLFHDVGRYRKFISIHELILLKRRYRMSIQALLYRLHELDVINDYLYKKWCIMIGKMGWRKKEPQDLDPEMPQSLDLLVYRAFVHGLLAKSDALQMLRLGRDDQVEITLVETQKLSNMSPPEHQELLARQVKEIETSNPHTDSSHAL